MSKRVIVLTRDKDRQFEALRTSLGLLLEHHGVSLIVLDHEIECSDRFLDNLGFIDEMGGRRFSDHPGNIERHGFQPLSRDQLARVLADQDLVLPF